MEIALDPSQTKGRAPAGGGVGTPDPWMVRHGPLADQRVPELQSGVVQKRSLREIIFGK